ncbi:MAG TPA: diacylglycerol kinase family protein [Terriglobales bacterium]|nr:diacylglycerol kinase family protein [Terriglobales bacterium]
MRAIAIRGQGVTEAHLSPFRRSGIELATEAASDRADAILVFGGDGTVHHQLTAAIEQRTPMLVVPFGSGNDFARCLGLATAEASLAAWKAFCAGAGNVRVIDAGRICSPQAATTAYFCCVAGAGLDADANRRANAMPRWLRGNGGYFLAAGLAILLRRNARFRFRAERPAGSMPSVAIESAGPERVMLRWADDPVIEAGGPGTLIAFANAPAYGGGFRMAPAARLDDGLLDAVFVHRIGRLRMLRLAAELRGGTHIRHPEVQYLRASRIDLESDPPLDLYADGEFIARTPLRIEVVPRALQVIVPAATSSAV